MLILWFTWVKVWTNHRCRDVQPALKVGDRWCWGPPPLCSWMVLVWRRWPILRKLSFLSKMYISLFTFTPLILFLNSRHLCIPCWLDGGVCSTSLDINVGVSFWKSLELKKWLGEALMHHQHYQTSPVECNQLLLDIPWLGYVRTFIDTPKILW